MRRERRGQRKRMRRERRKERRGEEGEEKSDTRSVWAEHCPTCRRSRTRAHTVHSQADLCQPGTHLVAPKPGTQQGVSRTCTS